MMHFFQVPVAERFGPVPVAGPNRLTKGLATGNVHRRDDEAGGCPHSHHAPIHTMTNPIHTMPPSRQILLITGPARSGKSEWAETLAQQTGQPVVYVATAQVDPADVEWQARIEQHQQRRAPAWVTWHVPLDLSAALRGADARNCLLVDSLGTWLANLLEQDDRTWSHTVSDLLDSLVQGPSTVIFVSEETGWGVVPAYPLGRTFRDRLGDLTRQIAGVADTVYLVTGGYVLDLRQLGQPLAAALSPSPLTPPHPQSRPNSSP